VAGFIGSPSMNFVEVTVPTRTGLWRYAGVPGESPPRARPLGPYRGQRVTLGTGPKLRVATGATRRTTASTPSSRSSSRSVRDPARPQGRTNVIVARVDPTVRVKHSDKSGWRSTPSASLLRQQTELAI